MRIGEFQASIDACTLAPHAASRLAGVNPSVLRGAIEAREGFPDRGSQVRARFDGSSQRAVARAQAALSGRG
jgi:hypothetical protein